MSRRRSIVLRTYTAAVLAFLMLPIGVMIVFGFNDTHSRFNYTWQGFTLHWYRHLFDVPDLGTALRTSIVVAALSTLFATVLGTMIAIGMSRRRLRLHRSLNLLIFAPMATPEIVMGASLLTLFITLSVPRGLITVLMAHVMFNISYVVITVRARTQDFNREWEDAARDLGATPATAFRTVTFPLIFPAILAAAALAFALSIDDFVVTFFVAGRTITFPLWVYGASRFGVPPQVNVMGTLLFVIGVALAGTALVAQRRR
jgi:spermidine/putrescine transport system permease protein